MSAYMFCHTNVVCTGEDNWNGDSIAGFINRDQRAKPDLLLVLGTSLKAHGTRDLVKRFSAAVRNNSGKIIYVDFKRPVRNKWVNFPDYWIEWDVDQWARDLKWRDHLWSLETMELAGELPKGFRNQIEEKYGRLFR